MFLLASPAPRHMYDPYSQVTVLNGEADADQQVSDWSADADNTGDWDNEILFCGYRLDGETGLYHVRNRDYHAPLGRWLQRDPLGYVDGLSLYEYVSSSPVIAQDPWGQMARGKRRPTLQERAVEALRSFHEARREFSPVTARVTGLDALIPRLERMLWKYEHRGKGNSRDSKFVYKRCYWWWDAWFRWSPTMRQAVFHEAIHALDFDNRWHAPGDEKDAERLAWAADAVDDVYLDVGDIEMKIRYAEANPTERVNIKAKWKEKWEDAKDAWRRTVHHVDDSTEPVTVEMIWDVNAKLGFRVSCSAIADAFANEWPHLKGCFKCPKDLAAPFK